MSLTALYKGIHGCKLWMLKLKTQVVGENINNGKLLLAMKLTAIILLSACLGAGASGTAQSVTLNMEKVPVQKVFKEVSKQTGISIIYSEAALKKLPPITIHVKNVRINEVLDQCLKNQPFEYKMEGNVIVVKSREQSPNEETNLRNEPPPPIDVKGRVTNEQGEPVAGASIKVKGTNIGTSTNDNGEFLLNVPTPDMILVISGVNIETLEVPINAKTSLVVSAKTKYSAGQEIVINKGYYTEKQKVATGNTFSVKAKDIEKQPVQNPLLALVGRVPGLVIEQQTGFANSGVVVRIQGRNSINSGLDPLYVIDGVPYLSQPLPTIGTSQVVLGSSGGDYTAGAGNPLSFINPNDIETIDILKDADATAIYGSRGANGVILITTKKGQPGQTRVTANFRSGLARVGKKVDLLNTDQYLEMRKEFYKNDGLPVPDQTTSPDNSNYDLTVWDQKRYTDWQKELIGGAAHYTDAQLSISGGNSNTQFLMSSSYHKETTVFPGDFADQKASFAINVNHTSNNQKFKMQVSSNYTLDNNEIPGTDLTTYALKLAPNAPALYNADGSLNWAPVTVGTGTVSTWTNPLSYLETTYSNKVNNFIGSGQLSYQLLPNLIISSRLGYNTLQSDEFSGVPLTSTQPELRSSSTRYALYGNGTSTSWIIEPQVSYRLLFRKGKLETLLGSSFQKMENESQSVQGSGYSSDISLKSIASAATVFPGSSLYNQYKYSALFGRLNYNYEDRYVINLTARRDGSSRFGPENRFNNFWGISGGWIFSNEKWMSSKPGVLNFGKLKISYGTTGNDQIGDYNFMNLYLPLPSYTVNIPYQGIPAMAPNKHANPYLQWEETRKLQFGLDLGFLRDRIVFNLGYYYNRSSNLLVQTKLSYITGFDRVMENFDGLIENTGWELAFSSFNIRNSNFSWTTNFNLTIPTQNGQLISFPNLPNTVYANTLTVGKSLYDAKRYHSLGVDPATGIYSFSDVHGNPVTFPGQNDQITYTNTTQKLYGGLQNNIAYKGFELDFALQFVKRDAQIFTGSQPGFFRGTWNWGNQPVVVLDRWQKPGDIKTIQKYTNSFIAVFAESYHNYLSDASVTDGSFIRLTNLALSWQLPRLWMNKAHLQNCKLTAQAQNVFTITKYKGLYPPVGGSLVGSPGTTLPPLQVVTIGAQVTF